MLGRAAVVLLAPLGVIVAAPAGADDCLPASGISSCFDADKSWLVAAPSRLAGLDTLEARQRRSWSMALAASYLDRPVRLSAPSPDPEGRELSILNRLAVLEALVDYAVDERLSAELALGLAWQSGSGVDAALSQRSSARDEIVFRDPRLGVAYRLGTLRVNRTTDATAAVRYRLTLPLGGAFAGSRSAVASPGFAFALHHTRLALASELAARFTSPVEIAGTRLGSELFAGLGGAYEIWRERIWLGLETWLWPGLLDNERRLPSGVRIQSSLQLPAEWLVSSELHVHESIALRLGFGSGLPLSSERRTLPDGSQQSDDFSAPPTPRWRGSFSVRFAPGAERR